LRVATEDASSLSTGDVADDYYAVLGLVRTKAISIRFDICI
jgi:hypothetical protein